MVVSLLNTTLEVEESPGMVWQEDLANWAGCLQDQREEFSAKNYSQQQVGH